MNKTSRKAMMQRQLINTLSQLTGFALLVSVVRMPVQAANNYRYNCEHGQSLRVIEVVYTQGTKVPCEVNYQREDGDFQVLWRAANTEGYCEAKADEFMKKQADWGWVCDFHQAQIAESPSNPVLDDTTAATELQTDIAVEADETQQTGSMNESDAMEQTDADVLEASANLAETAAE